MKEGIKNNIKIIFLLIVVFVVLYSLHIAFGGWFEDQYDNSNYVEKTEIYFSTDTFNKILTVEEIYTQGRTLHWSEVEVKSGYANLPYGPIDIDDEITECEGNLVLIWKDTGNIIFSADFS